MADRQLYLDRLRTVLTAQVILHHCAITYGGSGGWFFYERRFDGSPSSLLLTLFAGTQQAYFMGFFFLLAGYFTPSSFERKGTKKFLADRFLRLGLPLLGFIVLLGPLTDAMVDVHDGGSFWGTFVRLWSHQRIINGPLWFAEALLIFSLIYVGWQKLRPKSWSQLSPRPLPGLGLWLLSALLVGAFSLLLRQIIPVGQNIFGLQLGFFSSYIFLFALGIQAERNNWIQLLSWKIVRWPALVSICVYPLLWISCAYQSLAHPGTPLRLEGGFSLLSIVYAFWEPLFAWGVLGGLLVGFRHVLNSPSRLWSWLDRRAYAVFFLHPVVLVGVALAANHWSAPALLKFICVGLLSCLLSWLAAEPFVRLPGLRRIF